MLTEHDKRIERKELEFLTELRGVRLRLGFIIYEGNPCGNRFTRLPNEIAWELGIEEESDTSELLAAFWHYMQKKGADKC